jgi:cytochrome P450
MLFANLDVSAHVLNALVTFLAEEEDAQSRIFTELQKSANTDEYCSRRDTFLHYCLLETMRLRPIGGTFPHFALVSFHLTLLLAFTMPERSPHPKSFSDIYIPPYSWVLVDVFSINQNAEFWGEDSEDFRPSRFQDLDTKDVSCIHFGTSEQIF